MACNTGLTMLGKMNKQSQMITTMKNQKKTDVMNTYFK